MTILSFLFLLFGPATPVVSPATDTLPGAVVEEFRQSPFPNNTSIKNNAPALLWTSEKKNNGSDVLYKVYLSRDPAFPEGQTIESARQRFCFFNPHQKLNEGKWYWKYDIINKDQITTRGKYSFVIEPGAAGMVTPDFKTLLSRIPATHPRVMNQGRSLAQIQKEAPQHPLYKKIIEAGEKALTAPIYRGPVESKDPATERALNQTGKKEIDLYYRLLEAYVLSGNPAFKKELLNRTGVLLAWPTNDLLGSQVLMALSRGCDVLYNELPAGTKKKVLTVIDRQIKQGLKKWPGLTEARHVDNHFWQMELAGNFLAALATVNDLPSSNEMLEYTYELFMARFPNLATQEGGWAEGIGYFGVNKSAIVDMALMLKKSCGVDVFQMGWYQNLADYFFYFAPVDGRISGFGDMHERVNIGNVGRPMMLVEGEENQDSKALYRLSALLKAGRRNGQAGYEKQMAGIEPWYQVVNNIQFNPDQYAPPKNMEPGKMFKGVGLAAFHTNVLNSGKSTSLYFRSSPFGAKGHMHANQNCFNISRKGEPVFYSTGYYTSFADPHSLSAYRHTRAHNGILVNGNGQAFGHEGYGWIKRFISSESIGYVCGDATMAYRPTTDPQFLELCAQNKIRQTSEFGFGDAKLKLFERHIAFVHPNTVIIYDVLESAQPSEWTFLLHTMEQPELDENNRLSVKTKQNYAQAFVTGSGPLKAALTDQFFSPPVDFKKKYGATPNQYHASFTLARRSNGMRFLAVLQLNDDQSGIQAVKQAAPGVYKVGNIEIKAEMDAQKPALLLVRTGGSVLKAGRDKTTLRDKKGKMTSSVNMPIPAVVE
ncbi:DUF4962 domain-containing protein [Niabella aurantiaca]|uniref:DUF4962 domain-containing protein n=1 Tax=Niabella aurantiaca TaxID=379900 RepID=UPI0003806299|nr:DUF4962 domain-containing protein [Niabella aurantiaca]